MTFFRCLPIIPNEKKLRKQLRLTLDDKIIKVPGHRDLVVIGTDRFRKVKLFLCQLNEKGEIAQHKVHLIENADSILDIIWMENHLAVKVGSYHHHTPTLYIFSLHMEHFFREEVVNPFVLIDAIAPCTPELLYSNGQQQFVGGCYLSPWGYEVGIFTYTYEKIAQVISLGQVLQAVDGVWGCQLRTNEIVYVTADCDVKLYHNITGRIDLIGKLMDASCHTGIFQSLSVTPDGEAVQIKIAYNDKQNLLSRMTITNFTFKLPMFPVANTLIYSTLNNTFNNTLNLNIPTVIVELIASYHPHREIRPNLNDWISLTLKDLALKGRDQLAAFKRAPCYRAYYSNLDETELGELISRSKWVIDIAENRYKKLDRMLIFLQQLLFSQRYETYTELVTQFLFHFPVKEWQPIRPSNRSCFFEPAESNDVLNELLAFLNELCAKDTHAEFVRSNETLSTRFRKFF